jgi:biotin transport system permease protein
MGLALASVLIGLFHLYMQQPMVGAVSVLRLLCTTLMGIALTITTRYTDLLGVLEWLLAPLRWVGVQPERLSLQVALMLRFTEHFFVVWRRLDDAHRLRTGKAGGFKILAPLTLHMLIAARRVAESTVSVPRPRTHWPTATTCGPLSESTNQLSRMACV